MHKLLLLNFKQVKLLTQHLILFSQHVHFRSLIQDWKRRRCIRLQVLWRQDAFARRLLLKNWHHRLQLWLHLCWLNLILILALLVNRSVVVVAELLLSHRSQSWQLRAVLYKLQIRH